MLYRERIVGKASGTGLTLFTRDLVERRKVSIQHIGLDAAVAATRSLIVYLNGGGYQHLVLTHSVTDGLSVINLTIPLIYSNDEKLAFYLPDIATDESADIYLTGLTESWG